MPCNTITKSSVTLELKADNQEYLVAALKELGFAVQVLENKSISFYDRFRNVSGVFENGKLKISGYRGAAEQYDINPIKRAYSGEVVKAASKRFGWKLTQTESNKFTAKRRR